MEKTIQKRLLQLVAGTLTAAILAFVLFYYFIVQSLLIKNMDSSNQQYVDQVAASFDTVIDQITEQSYKLTVYNLEFDRVLQDMEDSPSATVQLYDILDSIVMSNRYIFSSYLYLPPEPGAEGRVFASEWGCSFPESSFYDAEILPYFSHGIVEITPARQVHTVNNGTNGGKKLLFSIMVPLPDSSSFLSVNVDIQLLYNDMLQKANASSSARLYIANRDGEIFAPWPSDFAGRPIQELLDNTQDRARHSLWFPLFSNQPVTIQSSTHSASLGWGFYLVNEMPFHLNEAFSQYAGAIFAVILLILLLGLSYFVIWRMTNPLREALFAYNEKVFRDILLSDEWDEEAVQKQLAKIGRGFTGNAFSLVLVEVVKERKTLTPLIQEWEVAAKDAVCNLDVRIVDLRPGMAALIFSYYKEEKKNQLEQRDTYLKGLYQTLDRQFPRQVYLTLSRQTETLSGLAALYTECLHMAEYKLANPSHFISYKRGIPEEPAPYPAHYEKQIVNNLMVGNEEGCILYARKFLQEIFSEESMLRDTIIQKYIYQLQNAILKEISSLPISIKLPPEQELLPVYQAEDIENWVISFLRSAAQKINQKNEQEQNILEDRILSYIRENLDKNDFNLNSMSYQFNMNRNYLTKLIKETTGKSFNDYVNQQRVEIAKTLLLDHSLTVETIAHQVGFSYAHYFIKIFKGLEGVTPGQYRDRMNAEHPKP